MKSVVLSRHAQGQLADRGATEEEVEETIRIGERLDAQQSRLAFRKNFPYHRAWKGKRYATKQVKAIVAEEQDRFIVVTVYVYYFGESV